MLEATDPRSLADFYKQLLGLADRPGVPEADVVLQGRPVLPSVGACEVAQDPTAAAIGNTLADAVGVRVRDLSLSAEWIVAAHEGCAAGQADDRVACQATYVGMRWTDTCDRVLAVDSVPVQSACLLSGAELLAGGDVGDVLLSSKK